jgi:hypothetical protein
MCGSGGLAAGDFARRRGHFDNWRPYGQMDRRGKGQRLWRAISELAQDRLNNGDLDVRL